MKRTNILLTEGQHKAVKAYAKREGKTLGRMVREALNAAYKAVRAGVCDRRAADAYLSGTIEAGFYSPVRSLRIRPGP